MTMDEGAADLEVFMHQRPKCR